MNRVTLLLFPHGMPRDKHDSDKPLHLLPDRVQHVSGTRHEISTQPIAALPVSSYLAKLLATRMILPISLLATFSLSLGHAIYGSSHLVSRRGYNLLNRCRSRHYHKHILQLVGPLREIVSQPTLFCPSPHLQSSSLLHSLWLRSHLSITLLSQAEVTL